MKWYDTIRLDSISKKKEQYFFSFTYKFGDENERLKKKQNRI